MADIALKIPPPPMMTSPEFQPFNRWLLELTKILRASGGIDPASIAGLEATIAQVVANTAAIALLQGGQAGQAAQIAALNASVAAIVLDIATINGQLTTLGARGELLFGAGAPAAGLGKVNDWYGDTAGAAGARIWIKKAVGVWTPFPF